MLTSISFHAGNYDIEIYPDDGVFDSSGGVYIHRNNSAYEVVDTSVWIGMKEWEQIVENYLSIKAGKFDDDR